MKTKRIIICFILIILLSTSTIFAYETDDINRALTIVSNFFNIDIDELEQLIMENAPLQAQKYAINEYELPEKAETQEDLDIIYTYMLYTNDYDRYIKTDLDSANIKKMSIQSCYNIRQKYPELVCWVDSLGFVFKEDGFYVRFKNKVYTTEEIEERQTEFFNELEEISKELIEKNEITMKTLEKDKAKIALKWIEDNGRYYHNINRNTYEGYTFIETGKASCQAYTSTYNTLLKMLGIECEARMGDTKRDNEGHIMTYANIDGEWVYIDSTFVDTVNSNRYKYFCMTEDEVNKYMNMDD